MKQLLIDIQNRLNAEVSTLNYIDEDWGQLDFYSPNPPVKFPAAIFDVTQAEWSNQGKLSQLGRVNVIVRIADMKLSNSSDKAPVSQREKAWAIYDVLKAVHDALHGYTGSEHYSKLIRKNQRRIKRDDGMRIYEIIYTCELYEGLTKPPVQKVKVEA